MAPVPEHIVPGAHKNLELRQHLLKEGAKLSGAVVHVGRRHGKLGRREQWRRTRGIKARFTDHGCSLVWIRIHA
jgi:hypothetical protein